MNKKYIAPLFITGVFFSATALAQGLPAFDDVDADTDGVLTQEEVNAALQGLNFSAADLDGNGTLSRDEYDTAIQKQTQRGG